MRTKNEKKQLLFTDLWRTRIYELYLNHMSRNGWHLSSIRNMFMYFERGERKDMMYKVFCLPKNESISMSSKTKEWTMISKKKGFYVFAIDSNMIHNNAIENMYGSMNTAIKKTYNAIIFYHILLILLFLLPAISLFLSEKSISTLVNGRYFYACLFCIYNSTAQLIKFRLFKNRDISWKLNRKIEYGIMWLFLLLFSLTIFYTIRNW